MTNCIVRSLRKLIAPSVVGCAIFCGVSQTQAESIALAFRPLTAVQTKAPSADGSSSSLANLQLTVADVGSSAVSFLLSNTGSGHGSATNLYFDDLVSRSGTDGSVLTGSKVLGRVLSVQGSGGVYMLSESNDGSTRPPFTAEPRSYPTLPGGEEQTVPFVNSASAWETTTAGNHVNGVNSNEWVKVVFALQPQTTFQDVLSKIQNGYGLRVGVLMEGFSPGSFEAGEAVNPVPTPQAFSAGIGLAIALAGVVGVRRLRNRESFDQFES